MTKKKIKDKIREDTYTEKLEKKLLEAEKRNKQLLTALRSAKIIIKELFIEKEPLNTDYYWTGFNNTPKMQRINKALKND